MIALVTLISSMIEQRRRKLTVNAAGRGDTRVAVECAPAGVDAAPTKGMVAVYLTTDNMEEQVVVGYLNVQQLAAAGEHRLFATDAGGNVVYNIWLRGDGTCLIGTSASPAAYVDNLTKFTPMNAAVGSLVTQVNANLAAIQTAITALGGTYTVVPVTVDMTAARSTTIKVQ